jgi:hypothetical protein
MAGEIAFGRRGPIGADGGEARGVGGNPGILAIPLGPAVEQLEQGLDPRPLAEADEHPAAFLAPLGKAGVDQDLDVAGDARLALSQDLRDLADRQLHGAQQHDDPEPGRIGQRGEDLGRGSHICGYKDIFIWVKRCVGICPSAHDPYFDPSGR